TVIWYVIGTRTTAAAGPVLVTFNCGVVICVVKAFSARRPSAVVTVAVLVTGPARLALKTASIVWAWPAASGAIVQASWLPSTLAGGCARTNVRPGGTASRTVNSRVSTLPVLVTVIVYMIS